MAATGKDCNAPEKSTTKIEQLFQEYKRKAGEKRAILKEKLRLLHQEDALLAARVAEIDASIASLESSQKELQQKLRVSDVKKEIQKKIEECRASINLKN